MADYEKELNSIIGNDAVEINNINNDISQVSTDIATFNVSNRTINIPPTVTDIAVKGDTNSRIITFELNRYFDGVDLSTKTIKINYENSEGLTDSNEVTNIVVTDNTFTFDWTIESGLTTNSGEVKIAIDCYEKDTTDNIIYRWQTIPLSFNILDTISVINNAIALSYEVEKDFVTNNNNLTTLTDIHDTDIPIEITNKTINTPLYEDIVVSMDNNSQILSFVIDRYIDNVDLSKKVIAIKYINALGESDRTFAVNVSSTDTKITFGWLIDSKATKSNGYVRFAIEFLGYLDNGNFYCWSTKPSQIEVSEGLYVDGSIEQPNASWLQSWQVQADNNLKNMELQLRVNSNYVQWKHYNDSNWENLFSLNDIQSGSGVTDYSNLTNIPIKILNESDDYTLVSNLEAGMYTTTTDIRIKLHSLKNGNSYYDGGSDYVNFHRGELLIVYTKSGFSYPWYYNVMIINGRRVTAYVNDDATTTENDFMTIYENLVSELTELVLPTKQDLLVSGENIKTINNQSLLDSGNIQIENKVEDVQVNAKSVIKNKIAEITVPTKVSELSNDNNFITNTVNDLINYYKKSETYDKTEINQLINNIENNKEIYIGINEPTVNQTIWYDTNEEVIKVKVDGQWRTILTSSSVETTDYGDLSNKPKINNIELVGNKTLDSLGIQPKGNYITDNNYVHTDNNFTENYKTKLDNIKELPTVTTADNDKILKVVNGVWTAVSLVNGDEVSY